MFQLDEDIAGSLKQIQNLAEIWDKLTPQSRASIMQAINCNKSEEFYRGALSAYHAAAVLMAEPNWTPDEKQVLLSGVTGLIASRLAYGEWPPQ